MAPPVKKKSNRYFRGRIVSICPIFVVLAAIFLGIGLFSCSAQAAFTEKINYQGKLTDNNSVNVADGAYDVVFKLYTSGGGGSAIWTESWTNTALWSDAGPTSVSQDDADCGGAGYMEIIYASDTNEETLAVGQYLWNTTLKESAIISSVTTGSNRICLYNPYSSWTNAHDFTNRVYVKSGLFSVMLGSVQSLSDLNFNQTLYLGVTVGADSEMTPRKVIGAVPAAFEAEKLGGYDWASPGAIGSTAANSGAFTTLNSTGITQLASTAGSTLNLGNSTGAATLASGGTSSWTNTAGNLTVSTVTSGTLALTSAGALNLTSVAASIWTLVNEANALNFDSNTLSIDALNNRVGIGIAAPTAFLSILAGTTSSASINIGEGVAPSTPAEGDIWYDGTHLYFRDSDSSEDILSGGVSYTEGNYIDISGTSLAFDPTELGTVTWYDGTAATDIVWTFDGETNDGIFGYYEDEDAFSFTNSYVGIGDISPDTLLDILSSAAAATYLSIYNTNAGDYDAGFQLGLTDETPLYTFGIDDSDSDKFKISSGSALGTNDMLVINGSTSVDIGSGATSVTIDVNGLVGIGTVGPDQLLDILSASNPQLRLTQTDGSVYADFQVDSNGDLIVGVDGTTNQLVLDNGGNVGIGTATPGYPLDVSGNAADYIARISNAGTSGSDGMIIYLADASADATNTYIAFSSAEDTTNGYIYNHATTTGTCVYGTTGGDYAEFFYSDQTDLKAGELVCIDPQFPEKVRRCQGQDDKIMGAVSDTYGFSGNDHEENRENPHWHPVGLIGQVSVFVSTENGSINPGDELTSSSVPGVAMKATQPGNIVGRALQKYDNKNPEITERINTLISTNSYSGKFAEAMVDNLDKGNIEQMNEDQLTLVTLKTETKNNFLSMEMKLTELEERVNLITFSKKINFLSGENQKLEDGLDLNSMPEGSLEFIKENITAIEEAIAISQERIANLDQEIIQIKNDVLTIKESQVVAKSEEVRLDLSVLEAQGGLIISQLAEFKEQAVFQKIVEFSGEVAFRDKVEFAEEVKMQKGAEISGEIVYDNDRAGYAVIVEGERTVKVKFDKEYKNSPLINATLSLQGIKDEELREATEDLFLASDVKFIVTNVTTKGFEIKVDSSYEWDISFAWQAVSVKDPKTFGDTEKEKNKSKKDILIPDQTNEINSGQENSISSEEDYNDSEILTGDNKNYSIVSLEDAAY